MNINESSNDTPSETDPHAGQSGYHTIAVDIDDSEFSPARVEGAIDLARRFGGRIIGLYHLPDMGNVADAWFTSSEDMRRVEQAFQARTEKARLHFEGSVAEAQIPSEWHTFETRRSAGLAHFSVYADLMVVSQDGEEAVGYHSCEHVVVESACPVLVLPRQQHFGHIGSHVMVAWNGSREAARAVTGSMPLLQRADKVEVVSVGQPYIERPDAQPEDHAILHKLERYGVPAVSRDLVKQGSHIDEQLFAEAKEEGADLIVIGAYSHPRLREVFFGGVTQSMLRHSVLPILTIH